MPQEKVHSVRDQRDAMQAYLRVLRANYRRGVRELDSGSRRLRSLPLELHLRIRRFDEASELLKLGESCLAALNNLYALRLAPFQPGDQILVTTEVKGFPPNPRRYLVMEVIWDKADSHHYVVWKLTKDGNRHKREYLSSVWPNRNIRLDRYLEPVSRETEVYCEFLRQQTKALLDDLLVAGDLSRFLPEPASEARPRQSRQPNPFFY